MWSGWTGRDQQKPNRPTGYLVTNLEPNHQPPQRKEEIPQTLNINSVVIAAGDMEEQALAETDFCTEFLDSVNPQSEVPADSQPMLSRGGPKDPLEEAANKGVSTDLIGRSNVPAMIFDSYVINHLCEKDEEEVLATWDPGESICTPRLIADVSDEKEPEHLRSWGCINNKLCIEGYTTRQVVGYGQHFSDVVCRDVSATNDGKVVPDAAFSRDAIADDVVLLLLESTQSRGVPAALESLSKLDTIAMYVTDDGGGGEITEMVYSRMTDSELPHQEIQDSVTGELERGVRCSPAINRAHGAAFCIQKLGCYVLPAALLEDLYDDGKAFMEHTIFLPVASPVRNNFHADFAEEERLDSSTFVHVGRAGHIPCIVTYNTRVSPPVHIIGAKTFEISAVDTLGLFYDKGKIRKIAGWNVSMTFKEWRHAALRFGLVEGDHIFDPGAFHGVKLVRVTFGGFGSGAAARCAVMFSRRVGNIPKFAAGEVDSDVVACGGCKLFCGNNGDLVAKPPFIETKVSELDECVANFDETKEPSVENGVQFCGCDNRGIKLYWGGDPMELPTFLDGEIYVSIRVVSMSPFGGNLAARPCYPSIRRMNADLFICWRLVYRLFNMEDLHLMQDDEQLVELVRAIGYGFPLPVERWIHGIFHISIIWLLVPQFSNTIQQSASTSFHQSRLADIIQVHFPNFRLEGKAIFMGGGVDRDSNVHASATTAETAINWPEDNAETTALTSRPEAGAAKDVGPREEGSKRKSSRSARGRNYNCI